MVKSPAGPGKRQAAATSSAENIAAAPYPVTRQWAEAVHRECPDVQGIWWTSRQDHSARALIVFGDRVGRGVLQQAAISRNLVSDPKAYRELLILAEKIGVDIVPKSTPD